jgi:hypothetical protein
MVAAPVSLGPRLKRTTTTAVRLRNDLSARDVWLAELLRQPGLPAMLLRPVLGHDLPIEKRLIVTGTRGIVAQVGLSAVHLEALGITTPMPSPSLLDSLAAQLLSPAIGALRAVCDDDLQVSVEEAGDGLPLGADWVAFSLQTHFLRKRLPVRVSIALAARLAERSARVPVAARQAAPLPLVVGHRLRFPLARLRALRVGDVLLAGATDAATCAQVHIDGEGTGGLEYLATARLADGRIEHLSPGVWPQHLAALTGGGPELQLNVVLARLTMPADQCRAFALGKNLAPWPRAASADAATLCLAGQTLADVRRTRVAGYTGFEIERMRPLGNRAA